MRQGGSQGRELNTRNPGSDTQKSEASWRNRRRVGSRATAREGSRRKPVPVMGPMNGTRASATIGWAALDVGVPTSPIEDLVYLD